jgi:hypothetical protein
MSNRRAARLRTAADIMISLFRATDALPAAGPWARPRPGLSRRSWPRWVVRAERLAGTLPWPHLLFAVATVFTIRLTGYDFGTFDQTLLVPILKHSVDPALYAADPFTALMAIHVSFFWDLFVPAYRLGLLEPAVFAAFVGITYLFFWSVWSLAQALFNNRLASAVSVAALAVPHFGLVGFTQLTFSLVNWNAVLPFTLWALALYLRRRYLAAFALLGVLYNFHCLSVNFALGLIVFASLADLRRVHWRNLLVGLAVFVALALPVLAWRASGDPLDFSLRPEWASLLIDRANPTLYQVFGTNPLVLIDTASFAALVAMFFIARRLAPPAPGDDTAGAARTSLSWMAAILVVVLVEWVVTTWLPVTLLVELQLGRVGVYALVLGYVYFAHYLAADYQAGRLSRPELIALVLALALPPLAFLALGLWALGRWLPAARWRPLVVAGLALGVFGASLLVAAQMGLWDPRVQVESRRDPWYAAQVWAREATPRQAVFITPPQIQGLFVPGWRVYSERATVVTLYDAIDIGYTPGYLDTWQPRFEAVAPGALARFRGNQAENAALAASAFYGLTDAQVLAVARQYGASYLVVERPHLRPWPVAYANQEYVIYDLAP